MTDTTSVQPAWWQWPTVLSLDAPLVVMTWQWLLGAVGRVRIGWPETCVVGLSVWLAYVADRWFEGWRVAPAMIRTQRHRFYQRYRWPMATFAGVVLATDLAVALTRLSPRELIGGLLLLAPTLLYVLSHQLIHRHRRWRAPKELCIAVLLAAGASVFVIAQNPAAIAALVLPIGFFGALCFTNVALIAVWEQEIDVSHGQVSLARQFRGTAAVNRILPLALAAAALLCTSPAIAMPDIAAHAVAASGVLLAVVDRLERRTGWQLARVLADAALLTPLIPLWHFVATT